MIGGTNLPPPSPPPPTHTHTHTPYKRLQIFATLLNYIFTRLRHITSKLGKFINFMSRGVTGFSLTGTYQKLKKPSKGLLPTISTSDYHFIVDDPQIN